MCTGLVGVDSSWLATDGDDDDDEEPLADRFAAAEATAGTKLTLPEEVQRRLYSLHLRARRGPPPSEPPSDLQQEQWLAWCDASDLTAEAAMREYCAIVKRAESAEPAMSSEAADQQAIPTELMQALEAAGFKQAAAGEEDEEDGGGVWSAARAGVGLAKFLPGQRDALDDDGLSPLHHAVDAEQTEAVRALLAAGADAAAVDDCGSSPLHYAAMLGAENIAELLLGVAELWEVDLLGLRDAEGLRPTDVASSEGHKALAEQLRPLAAEQVD